MKNIKQLFIVGFILINSMAFGQVWEDISANLPNAVLTSDKFEVQTTKDSSTYVIAATYNLGLGYTEILTYRYTPGGAWNLLNTYPTSVMSTYDYISSTVYNNTVYAWAQIDGSSGMVMLKIDGDVVVDLGNQPTSITSYLGFGIVADPSNGNIYSYYEDGGNYYIDIFTGTSFVTQITGPISGIWENFDLYIDATNIYLSFSEGSASYNFGVFYGPKANSSFLNMLQPVLYNGSFTLTSNDFNNKLLGNLNDTTSILTFDTSLNIFDVEITPNYTSAIGLSATAASSLGAVNTTSGSYISRVESNTLKIIKKDYANNSVNNYAPPITGAIGIQDNKLSKPQTGGRLVASFKDGSTPKIFLLNNDPTITVSPAPVSFLCANTTGNELLLDLLQLEDLDSDSITLTSLLSTDNAAINPANVTTTITKIGTDYYVYLLADIGNVTSNQTVTLNFTFSDGIQTLSVIKTFNIVKGKQFTITQPITICNTENEVNLFDYVDISGGFFTLPDESVFNNFNPNIFTSDTTITFSYVNYDEICLTGTATNTLTVLVAPQITNEIITPPSNCVSNDGEIALTYNNGSSVTASILWSNNETSAVNSNLGPNLYFVEIAGSNGCITKKSFELLPSNTTVNLNTTNSSCFNSNDGSAIITNVTGMTAPYTYFWDNGQSGNTASGLYAGNHFVTITDAAGCSINQNYIITQPTSLDLKFSLSSPTCGLNDGTISTTTLGGIAPFTYLWSSGQTNSFITSQISGLYSVSVIDANGCSLSKNVALSDANSATLTAQIIEANCNANNGSINLFANILDGSSSVSFLWNTGQTSPLITNLSAGVYNVKATTSNGCKSYGIYEIKVKAPSETPICVITVDEPTTSNFLVWEKPIIPSQIDYYNIYRETDIFNQYIWIDSVNFDTLSTFNDVVASPQMNSWRYKISTVNDCSVESPLSFPHRTIHLTATDLGSGQFSVKWNKYEGTSYANFELFRYTTAAGWVPIVTLPTTVTQFTDVPSDLVGLDYKVEITLTATCSATKAEDYNYVRSNREKGKFVPGIGTGNSSNNSLESLEGSNVQINMYPNPVNDILTVELKGMNTGVIQIFDAYGRLVETVDIIEGSNSINCNSYQAGVYTLKVLNINNNKHLKFVKQ